MDQIAEIAAAIKETRERLRVSQRELARRLGIAPATMNRIEKGSGNIEARTLLRIAEALDVEPAILLGSQSAAFLEVWEIFKDLPDDRKQRVIDHIRDQRALSKIDR